MKIGYARVSTEDQDTSLQLDALSRAGCERIYQEKITGAGKDRPELVKLLDQLRPGDVVVIWKLDRLARSITDLIALAQRIKDVGAALHSLNDQIDTTSPAGKFTFHLFAALAEFERDIIRERTKAGLEAARSRGRKGGRPAGLSPAAKRKAALAKKLHAEGEMSAAEICEHLSISKSTFYNYLHHQGLASPSKTPSKR